MNLQDQLNQILIDLQGLKVESTLIIGAILLLIASLINKSDRLAKSLFAGTLILAFYFNWLGFPLGSTMTESLVQSGMGQNVSGLLIFSALGILLFNAPTKYVSEFYFFIISLLLGSILLIKANSILVVFLAIELASFAGYLLVNFGFRKRSFEASIKYLLIGATSSAITLLGFGIIYGVTNTFYISDWFVQSDDLIFNVGLILVIIGIFFKASIVPFHIWVPAVYQTAPAGVTALLAILPKLGALVLLQRVFDQAVPASNMVFNVCLVLGILTILVGTFSAIEQTNARRLVSFGAIAHSGFLLPLVMIQTETAVDVFWWYAVIYAIMSLGIFFVLGAFENKNINRLEEYAGVGSHEAILGTSLTVILISLIGLPPLAGFTAKLFLFASMWEYYTISLDLLFLSYLLVAIMATAIALFYYLKVPYQMYLVKPKTSQSIEFSNSTKFIATLFSIVLLLLFFVPHIVTVMQELLNRNIAP